VRHSTDQNCPDIAAMTAAMAAGDERSIELFYRRYFDRLYGMARRAGGRDEAFCLDVVQESVLRVLRNVRRVSEEAQLVAWLGLVVRTTAYDLLKSENRRRRREAVVAVGADAVVTTSESDEERIAWLGRQIARMDPAVVRAIDLRYSRGWTLARVANALGISIGSVDGRLRRALHTLRSMALAEEVDDA
jgi:RNA polymerase sigma factor (sigma-70 family)